MKKFISLLSLLLVSAGAAFADTSPSDALVQRFIAAAQPQKAVAASIEGSVEQLAAGAPAEAQAQMRAYFERVMGWEATKDDYARLIASTYTAEELEAALKFLDTPAGKSMSEKEPRFERAIAELVARNIQSASNDDFTTSESTVWDEQPGNTELVVTQLTRREVNGRIYFTGRIENRGEDPARSVSVVVNLFQGDQFVDQYSEYLSGAVAPGAGRYFKVSCGCKNNPPAEHDRYEAEIIQGY